MKNKAVILVLVMLSLLLPFYSFGETKLEIVWMGWPKAHVMQLVDRFEALNPDIAVDIQLVPFSNLFQTLEVRLSSGDTPDAYIVDGPLTSSYAVRGNLLPLDGFFSKADLKA